MNITVLGAGQVGFEVAKQLSFEEHDVSIIDNDPERLRLAAEKLDVKPILGSATSLDALKKSELEGASVVIATTSSDETNIVACEIADLMFGVKNKIAILREKSYANYFNALGQNRFSIDLAISPDNEIATIVKRSVTIGGLTDFVSCINDRIKIVGFRCVKGGLLIDVPVKFVTNILHNIPTAVLFITRNGNSFIPKKNDILKQDDNVYFAVESINLQTVLGSLGIHDLEQNNILIIGGESLSQEVVKLIASDENSSKVKILENNFERAELLSEALNDVGVIYGDPLDQDIIKQAIGDTTPTLIALTSDDKVNILVCLLAQKMGIARVSALVRESQNMELVEILGLQSIIDSKQAVITKILQYIKGEGSEIIPVLSGNQLELTVIEMRSNSQAIGLLTDDFNTTGEDRIAVLVRSDKVFILPKRMVLNAGDKILLVSNKNDLRAKTQLLKRLPAYIT